MATGVCFWLLQVHVVLHGRCKYPFSRLTVNPFFLVCSTVPMCFTQTSSSSQDCKLKPISTHWYGDFLTFSSLTVWRFCQRWVNPVWGGTLQIGLLLLFINRVKVQETASNIRFIIGCCQFGLSNSCDWNVLHRIKKWCCFFTDMQHKIVLSAVINQLNTFKWNCTTWLITEKQT